MKADAPVMKADASSCCAAVGISKKPAAVSPSCCGPGQGKLGGC